MLMPVVEITHAILDATVVEPAVAVVVPMIAIADATMPVKAVILHVKAAMAVRVAEAHVTMNVAAVLTDAKAVQVRARERVKETVPAVVLEIVMAVPAVAGVLPAAIQAVGRNVLCL